MSLNAERSILGGILLENAAYKQAAEHLKPKDFSLDSHRRIYSRMVELADSGRVIDPITLAEELDRHEELEAIGGYAYISGLLDGVPDRPSIEHYIASLTMSAVSSPFRAHFSEHSEKSAISLSLMVLPFPTQARL